MLSENNRGALLMIGAMASFTCNDSTVKVILGDLPLFQTLFLRGIGAVAALWLVSRWMEPMRFDISRRDWVLILVRGLCELGSAFFFLSALQRMPLPNATAILQALPLALTLAGVLFLGERVGWRRMTAVLVGFFGVMLIIKPGPEGFESGAVYAIASVLSVVGREILTRKLSPGVPSMTVAMVMAVQIMVATGIGAAMIEWEPVDLRLGLLFVVSVTCLSAGYVLSIMAVRVGELSVVMPFRYTGMLWALVLGYVVFDFWPDPLTLLGAAIVVATGIFTFYREQQLAAREQP